MPSMPRRSHSQIEIEPAWPARSLSEEASHQDHHAALAATVFGRLRPEDELVLELDAGQLRLKKSER